MLGVLGVSPDVGCRLRELNCHSRTARGSCGMSAPHDPVPAPGGSWPADTTHRGRATASLLVKVRRRRCRLPRGVTPRLDRAFTGSSRRRRSVGVLDPGKDHDEDSTSFSTRGQRRSDRTARRSRRSAGFARQRREHRVQLSVDRSDERHAPRDAHDDELAGTREVHGVTWSRARDELAGSPGDDGLISRRPELMGGD